MVVFVALAILGLALVTHWFQRPAQRVSLAPQETLALPPEEFASPVGPAPLAPRPFEQARAEHLASLKARVAYFAGGSNRVRCELDQGTGLWRVWSDAPSYEKSILRATWRTESGAWRLLLRSLLGPEFGGIWLAVTK